ncbi:MAG: DUF2232 domain-containing protein [Eubacteriales bacterium]
MQQQRFNFTSDFMLLVAILLSSILIGISTSYLIFEFILAIPIIIYVYKKDVNNVIMGIVIINLIIHTLMFDYFSSFIVFSLFLLPSIFLGRLLKSNRSLAHTVAFVTLFYFMSVIVVIFLYNQFNDIDVFEEYDKYVEQQLEDLEFDEMLEENGNENLLDLNEMRDTIQQYYLAALFIFSLVLIFLQTLFARIILNKLGWLKFELKRLLTYNPPRSFLLFFIGLFMLKSLVNNPPMELTVENLIVICGIVFFVIGLFFEVFLIYQSKTPYSKILLVILTIICLIALPNYFIWVGCIEVLLRLRDKFSKSVG